MKPDLSKAALWAGVIAGPLFYLVVITQAATREGYDLSVHPISLLALGSSGWVQTLNFVVLGLLYCFAALWLALVGKRRVIGSLLFPAGIGFLIAAMFPADPFMNFPPEAVMTDGGAISNHAKLHGVGFMLAFSCIFFAVASAAIAGWRRGSTGFAAVSLMACLGIVATLFTGLSRIDLNSESFFLLGLIAFGWISAFSWSRMQGSWSVTRVP